MQKYHSNFPFAYCTFQILHLFYTCLIIRLRLLLGLMITTMFLSMWMNNTSTTAMMVPIVSAIMDELRMVNEIITRKQNTYIHR